MSTIENNRLICKFIPILALIVFGTRPSYPLHLLNILIARLISDGHLDVGRPSDIVMAMIRGEIFSNNEFYHIYNRGVDKRDIFSDKYDLERLLQSIDEFNSVEPIGSIFENSFLKNKATEFAMGDSKLTNIIAYCLNPNHYHIILEQLVDNGISIFMKRLGGYTKYFNEKYGRSGVLFQGRYKVKHVDSNEYLLHLSAYVNLNYEVHGFNTLGRPTSKLTKSSWEEYVVDSHERKYCKKSIILDQFKSKKDYENFARDILPVMQEKKKDDKELKLLIMD